MNSLFALIFVSISAFARHPYYPTTFRKTVSVKSTSNELKQAIFNVLSSYHQNHSDLPDTLGCQKEDETFCYKQVNLGYREARKILFGTLHLEEDSRGPFIKDVYCRKELTRQDTQIGQNKIPDPNVLNCEHTWPQSKFSSRFDSGLQKSDLHHLFPADSRANSIRGNHEFDELSSNGDKIPGCDGSYTQNGGSFEPPEEHKGNVARALFYFSIRYQIAISAHQEEVLRQWHIDDPVDQAEKDRNDLIYKFQKNRNPFIDYPELVERISDF